MHLNIIRLAVIYLSIYHDHESLSFGFVVDIDAGSSLGRVCVMISGSTTMQKLHASSWDMDMPSKLLQGVHIGREMGSF